MQRKRRVERRRRGAPGRNAKKKLKNHNGNTANLDLVLMSFDSSEVSHPSKWSLLSGAPDKNIHEHLRSHRSLPIEIVVT